MTAPLIKDKHKPKLKPEHAPLFAHNLGLSPSLSAQGLRNKRLSTAPSHHRAAGRGWTFGATIGALSFCRSAWWSAARKKVAWVMLAPTLATWASANSGDGATWDRVFRQGSLFSLYLGLLWDHPVSENTSCLQLNHEISSWLLGCHFFQDA